MEFCMKVGGGRYGTEDMSDHTCVYLLTQTLHSRETFLPTAHVAGYKAKLSVFTIIAAVK